MRPRPDKADLLRGTLELLILRTLELRLLHGVAIAERIRQVTRGTFDVQPGRSSRPCTGWSTRRGSARAGRRRSIYDCRDQKPK